MIAPTDSTNTERELRASGPAIPAYYFRETSVLGALMLRPGVLAEAMESLGDTDDTFIDRSCGAVYRTMVQLSDEKVPVTAVSVWARLSEFGDDSALIALQDALDAGSRMTGPDPASACRRRMGEMTREFLSASLAKGYAPLSIRDQPRPGADSGSDEAPLLSFSEVFSTIGSQSSRIATGVKPWDDSTNGGISQKALTVVMGPPGSGKTTLLAQVARNMVSRGVAVAWLGIDESVSSIVIRMLQAEGISATAASCPEGETKLRVDETTREWSILFCEDTCIEPVISGLAERFPDRERVVFIDSLQTARTKASQNINETRLRIDEFVLTAKRLASDPETQCALVVSSEVSRASYRSRTAAQNIEAIASAKESGSIEFQADAMIDIRNVKNSPDLVTVEVVKARGPNTKRGAVFTLRLDRPTATFEVVEDDAASLEGLEKDAAQRVLKARIFQVVRDHPGCSSNFVHSIVGGKKALVLAALEGLEIGKQIEGGDKQRKSWKLVPHSETGSGNWLGTGTGSAGSRPLGAEPAASGE